MTLYARSDLMAVAVPIENGGCGVTHSRPVRNGAPAQTWALVCPMCETFLREDLAKDINKNTPGDKVIPHVVGQWSGSAEGIPDTPDEERERKELNLRSERQKRETQERAFESIGAAIQGNQEMMAKMAELIAFIAQKNTSPREMTPASTIVLPPVSQKASTETSHDWDHRTCVECGVRYERAPGQRGMLPKRCPEHNAARKSLMSRG